MSTFSSVKKIKSKIHKYAKTLKRLDDISCVVEPTKIVFVCNVGFASGFDSFKLLKLFQKYGSIESLITLPNRPYSFVVFDSVNDAVLAVEDLNGKCVDILEDKPVYLTFAEKVPENNEFSDTSLPPDAILLENFVTINEEKELLELEPKIDETKEQSLKHRLVWHYGYEFDYNTNNIDKNKPLHGDIPELCQKVMQRMVQRNVVSELPDQITCNRYEPGQGIPPHVDTHSAFEDAILSLSLGSDAVMEFTHISSHRKSVFLPRRSLLVMKGESRYGWTHCIACRKTDIVPKTFIGINGELKTTLSLSERSTRTSFTFRKIRQAKCECNFKELCDSQKESKKLEISEELAKILENKHVCEVYDSIADHFSETRFKPWPNIASFLANLSPGSFLIDVGCGNGKYLGRNSNLIELGCDLSGNLLSICKERNLEVAQCNILQLPFKNNCADACLCIAVLHHLSTMERRRKAIEEIIRILTLNGQALIYVWSMEQETNEGVESNYLKKSRCQKVENINKTECGEFSLPVHVNRTKFTQQDMFVPWKSNQTEDSESEKVFHRFYHVFIEGELEKLVENLNNVKIVKSFYDKGNWCVILKKV